MTAAGVLTADDRVELIEGWIVPKMTKQTPHVIATGELFDALLPLVAAGHYLAKEDPVNVGRSVPEPDIAVIRGGRRDYHEGPPGAENVALLVEVADDSLHRDRTEKAASYARAGIQPYWIVNLVDRRVEVHTDPSGPAEAPGYGRVEVYDASAEVPVVLDGREVGRIAVGAILP